MNTAVTITQFPSETVVKGSKIAKLFGEKVNIMSKRFSDGLASLGQPSALPVSNAPTVVEPSKTKDYNNILNMFNLTCYEFDGMTNTMTGARKLKVNPIVSNNAKNMYLNCKKEPVKVIPPTIIQPPVDAIKQEPLIDNSISRVSRLEAMNNDIAPKPSVNPIVNNKQVVNTSNDNLAPTVSIDDYLQQNVPKDEDYAILQLSQNNEKLKEEINKSQSIMQQLEQQLKELKSMHKQKIAALEEERLSHTATLNGLTEQIRLLQEAIDKEKQTLGE